MIRRTFIRALLVLLVAAASVRAGSAESASRVAAPGPAAGAAAERAGPAEDRHVRGMTISCHGDGQSWGSDAMVESMAQLKAMGVNWIAIHPYASIREDGTVGGSRMDRLYDDPTWLTRPIREAHRLGLKILIKPHIAYWGSSFRWRGQIAFHDEDAWRRFFFTYERWITMVAELSKGADAFAVGTELDGTTHRAAEWRHIIKAVRERLDVPLTYCANWDRYETVPFWGDLDAVGVQSYFPLVGKEGLPSQAELDAAWDHLIRRLEAFGRAVGRTVVLGELGYNRSSLAAVRPWEYRTGGPDAEEIQRRCLSAALRALDGSEGVVGAFLWKWFPGEPSRGNFLMSTPAMREVIAAHWGASRR